MYEIIPQENGYGIVGVDGDVIITRPTPEEAAATAAELKREYSHLVVGFDLAGAVEEAQNPPNLFIMDRETHQEIARQTNGRKRTWSRIMGTFTEKMEFPPRPRKPYPQEEYQQSVGWIPSSGNRLVLSNDEKKWASKLRAALQ